MVGKVGGGGVGGGDKRGVLEKGYRLGEGSGGRGRGKIGSGHHQDHGFIKLTMPN